MSGYSDTQAIQYWLKNYPQAVIPTWGVRPSEEENEHSCRCHRRQPCGTSAGKHPKLKWADHPDGLHPNVIGTYLKAWLNDPTSVGWAIATGRAGLAVLDVDPRHGGIETLRSLLNEHGPLPLTPHDQTGGGGFHWYFQWAGHTVGKSAIQVGPGVELLSGNHLIQVAPSIHYTGNEYRWIDAPHSTPFADPPTWLADKLRAAAAPPVTTVELKYAQMQRLLEGDSRINRARAYLARVPVAVSRQNGWQHTNKVIVTITCGFNLNDAEAFEVLSEWNLGCSPPWSHDALKKKIRWSIENIPQDGRLLDDDRRQRQERIIKVKPVVRGSNCDAGTLAPVADQSAACEDNDKPVDVLDWVDKLPEQDRLKFLDRCDDLDYAVPDGTPTCSEIEKERMKKAHARKMEANAATEIEQMRFSAFPCPRARSIVTLRTDHKTDEKSICVIQPRCECWSCAACGHLHRGEWALNYQCRINCHYWVPGPDVYGIEVPKEEQTKVAMRIRRLGGEYFYIDTPESGIRFIVSNKQFAGSTEIPKEQAIAMLTSCVNQFRGDHKPGGSSRGWALPKRVKSPHEYDLLAVVDDPLDDDGVHERLSMEKVAFEPVDIPSAHRFRITRYRQIKLGKKDKVARERVLKRLLDIPLIKIKFGKKHRAEIGELAQPEREKPELFDQPCKDLSEQGWSNTAPEREIEHAF